MPWRVKFLIKEREVGVTLHNKSVFQELLDKIEDCGYEVLKVEYIGEAHERRFDLQKYARSS